MTKAEVEALLELDKKATPGPWDQVTHFERDSRVGAKTLIANVYSERFLDKENQEANANLISQYRTALPRLAESYKRAMSALNNIWILPRPWIRGAPAPTWKAWDDALTQIKETLREYRGEGEKVFPQKD